MTTIFIYEHITALGARAASVSLAPSLLLEGRTMLDAIVQDFAAWATVWTLEQNPFGLYSLEDISHLAAKADFTFLIAPETDGVLEQLAQSVVDAGGQLLGPTPEAIRLTSNKWALFQHLQQQGIPTPQTWKFGTHPIDLYPQVWKPIDGAGSEQTFVIHSIEEQQQLVEGSIAWQSHIVQPYCSGLAASVAFLIGPQVCLPLLPCEQLLSSGRDLKYQGGRLPLKPDYAQRAIAISEPAVRSVKGLQGYIGVDVVLGEQQDWVIEINPRLTTSYVGLRFLAKDNLSMALWQVVTGQSIPSLSWKHQVCTFDPAGQVQEGIFS